MAIFSTGEFAMLNTKNYPLRRTERALTTEQAFEVIEASEYAVISTADEAGIPYGVAVSPVYYEGAFYFHTTNVPESRRNANMLANPEVSLFFVSKAITLPEWYSVDFASAVVTGRASLVEDPVLRVRAMLAIVKHYAPENSDERNATQMAERFSEALIWKVEVDHIQGKARAAKQWVPGKTVKAQTETEPSKWLVGVK